MTPEFNPMDPALEEAVREIRGAAVEDAVMEAAAARVWTRLAEAAAVQASTIRSCSDFQALIPEYRAGRLTEGRAMLLQDHLHQCVACRHVYEGRVSVMPPAPAVRRPVYAARWALAATVLIVAGVTIWWVEQAGVRTGPAIVQSVEGTLYAVTADGIHPLSKGQNLPADVELRTAKDSDAMLQLADGSIVEMRERSSLATSAGGSDITIRLGRGSVIVKAAHRNQGNLFVDTSDCRVSVTGTLFGVTAGLKGSRVSVVQGEVRVTQDNGQKIILHAGDQTVTSPNVEPEPVSDEIAWSKNRENLLKQLREGLKQLHMPDLRYSSKLLDHLPAATTVYISIPNLAQYLGDAESVLSKKLSANPQLRSLWNSRLGATVELLRNGSEYLGDEIDIVANGEEAPVIVAEEKRAGLNDFLKKKGIPLTVVSRGGLVLFGPERKSVDWAASQLDSGFPSQPLYGHIAQSYEEGAGMMIWADLAKMQAPIPGIRYFFAEQKQMGNKTVASAALGFDGPRTGIAAQLAAPSPMGSLDYVSPDAQVLLAFVVKDPAAIMDAVLSVAQGSRAAGRQEPADTQPDTGFDLRRELAASLGGEVAIALDGSVLPVPSWKLVSEVYDPARVEAALQHMVEMFNQDAAHSAKKPLRLSQEVVDGRTYYVIAQVDGGPLLEAHYTFDRGYLVAGPTRALVAQALNVSAAGTSIKHASRFLDLTPRDQHVNFSAVVYQNLGNSIAPLAAFASMMAPQSGGRGNMLQGLTNLKPTLYAVYGEPDRITMTANGDVLGSTLASLLSGDLRGLAGISLPTAQMAGTRGGR